jgi:hypothetical protein
MDVVSDAHAWAQRIVSMTPTGWPPQRCVLVPRERVAHALRRELVRSGKGEALVGTRFVRPPLLGFEVVQAAGVECTAGEEALRKARVHALLREGPKLKHFPIDLLLERPGWDEALARTISELEAANLRSEDLPADSGPMRDVAAIWRALDEASGQSWTEARIFLEAAARLKVDPKLWRGGVALAGLTGHEDAAQLAFVRAIPGVKIALFAPEPHRAVWRERVATLVGAEPQATPPAKMARTQRDLLAAYLFAPPEVLADPARPRKTDREGSVLLAEHSGVEEEVEASARWVARRVLEDRIALQDIAVLAPAADPWLPLVATKLARIDWPGGPMPIYVAGGLPLAGTGAGTRLLALVRALRAWLPIEQVAALLPSLRAGPEGHLSRTQAIELATSLGTVGGSSARPEGAREWGPRAEKHAQNDPQNLAARLCSALLALSELAMKIGEDAPLADLVARLSAFADAHLLQPGVPAMPILAAAAAPLCREPTGARLVGQDALAALEDVLLGLRIPQGRFGEPRVYVGTVESAVGLPFRAVRIVGLAEGTIPAAPREDPVLPESERRRLNAPGLRTPEDRVLAQFHALRRVVQDTSEHVALSASRVGPDGTQREPSAVFLEAFAALGHPLIDLRALRRDAFRPARKEADSAALAWPPSESARLWRVARAGEGVPGRWLEREATDPRRARGLREGEEWAIQDGILGAPVPGRHIPGMTAERAISASGLADLLKCPHFFLYKRLLRWEEPAVLPSAGLDPLTYGSLFHDVAERFYRENGEAFGAHKRSPKHWKSVADDVAERAFDEFAESWPFGGEAIRDQQKARLMRDLASLIDHDWLGGARAFVDVERKFGEEAPVQLFVGGGQVVHLHGRIDRLDVGDGRLLVRDLKTGRAKPRHGDQAGPVLAVDLQLAVYGLVARQLAREWKVPGKIDIAYVYPDVAGEHERAFRGREFDELAELARGWLGTARGLLEEGSFPRTPLEKEDCKYCAFNVVCGTEGPERASELFGRSEGALLAYGELRVPPEPEEEDE